MAFESLSDKLSRIFKKIKGQARLTEANMEDMLREIRVALLEADVNYKVVKEFTNNIREKALGQEVLTKLNPSQMLVKIVHEELVKLLGSEDSEIHYKKGGPTIIMMVGLQGSGKTTTTGKLAYLMKNKLKKKVLLAAGDVYRPDLFSKYTLSKSDKKLLDEILENNNEPEWLKKALEKGHKFIK